MRTKPNLTITKIKTVFFISGFIGLSAPALAEESNDLVPGLEVHGALDFYYQLSPQARRYAGSTSGPLVIDGRVFDKHANQVTLNMAEFSLKKKVEKITFKTDIAFGEMVDQLSGGGSQASPNAAANESTRNITQATLSYAVDDRLSLTAGKFYTHMGLEVTKPRDNFQYSRSYAFNYGIPFWHEGASATYAVLPGFISSTVYVLNAWEGRLSQEQNNSATFGANLNLTGLSGLTLNYNYIGGSETVSNNVREVHEINLTYILNPGWTFAADYLAGSQKAAIVAGNAHWKGFAFYAKASLNDVYFLSPRYEVFDDADGFAVSGGLAGAGIAQKISSFTLTNGFNLGSGLEARLEFRSDRTDSELYFRDRDGQATKAQDSYVAAVTYAF